MKKTTDTVKESRMWKIKCVTWTKIRKQNRRTRRALGDQNQGKAVITGFHSETSESEVIQFLTGTITEIGMTIENARIARTAHHTDLLNLDENKFDNKKNYL